MSALEQIIRRFARQTRVNGVLALTSNGDAALAAAFAELGWSDPYPIEPVVQLMFEAEGPAEAAVVSAPETAVLDTPEGHIV
jgi:hypothetical protein